MSERRPLVDPKSMTLAEAWLGDRNGETERDNHSKLLSAFRIRVCRKGSHMLNYIIAALSAALLTTIAGFELAGVLLSGLPD